MDEYKTFVTDSLREFDKNMKEQQKLFKNASYFDYIQTDNSMENDKIIFYDNDDKMIFEADFEAISTYDPENRLWTWGWGNPSWKRKWTRIISKILNYGLTLDPEKSFHLKLELVNSIFIISDRIQIDIHLAIASSLSKIPYIYTLILSQNEEKTKTQILKKENLTNEEKNTKNKAELLLKFRSKILKEPRDADKILYLFLFNIKKASETNESDNKQ